MWGVIDAGIVAPTLHWLFNVGTAGCTVNTYLHGECDILAAVRDVTPNLGTPVSGRILLIPASDDPVELARAARESYNFEPLCDDSFRLLVELGLDVLLLDAPPGLTEGSLFLLGVSDASGIVLRLDKQDYQGTGVMVDVARRLGIPRLTLVVNLTPQMYEPAEVRLRVAETYHTDLVAVLPDRRRCWPCPARPSLRIIPGRSAARPSHQAGCS